MYRVLMSDGSFMLVDDEIAQRVKKSLTENHEGYLSIGDNLLNKRYVRGVVGQEYCGIRDNVHAGNWLCKHRNWHAKGEGCKCGFNPDNKPMVKPLSREGIKELVETIKGEGS